MIDHYNILFISLTVQIWPLVMRSLGAVLRVVVGMRNTGSCEPQHRKHVCVGAGNKGT